MMFQSQHRGSELLAVLGAALLVGSVSTETLAQAHMQRPSFDVASIRAHDPNDRKNWGVYQAYPGGRFTSTNSSPWLLIHYAFQLQPFQISGGPAWIKSKGYDLDAKPAEVHTNFDDIPLMLQGLLEDRFHLKYHWETREEQMYDLVVIKSAKLRASIIKGDCAPPSQVPEWLPKDAPCGGLQNSSGYIKVYNLTASDLAAILSWLLSKSISDKTNLTGKYDIELKWTPESVEMRSDNSSEQETPDIFTAIQEQLDKLTGRTS